MTELSAAAVRVRVAGPEDAGAVKSVLLASHPALLAPWYPAELLDVVMPMLTRANPALLACGTFHLALAEDGTALGCGGWTFQEPARSARPRTRRWPTSAISRHGRRARGAGSVEL